MHKFVTVLASVLLSMSFCVNTIHGQEGLTLHVGAALPSGEFAEDDGNDAGQASIGVAAGLEYVHPLNDNGLSLFGSLDVIVNWLKADYRDDIEDANPGLDITFPKYISAPLSGGLRYDLNTNGGIGLYFKGGVLLNLLKPTNFKAEDQNNQESETEYELSTKVGAKLGAGIQLENGTQIGITLIAPGEHDIDADQDGQDFSYDQEVSIFLLTVGFPLN